MAEKNNVDRNTRSLRHDLSRKELFPQDSPEMRGLQAELDQMAREVPAVPESFRQGWRAAVRQEAAKNTSAPQKKLSWRRSLSIAAVFAFILGGTLLSRDSVSLIRTDSTPSVLPAPTASPVSPTAAVLPTLRPEEDLAADFDIQAADSASLSMAAQESEEDSAEAEFVSESAPVSASGNLSAMKADSASETVSESDSAASANSSSEFSMDPEEAFGPESEAVFEAESAAAPKEFIQEDAGVMDSILQDDSAEMPADGETGSPDPASANSGNLSVSGEKTETTEKAASASSETASESRPSGLLHTIGIILIGLAFLLAALLLILRDRIP